MTITYMLNDLFTFHTIGILIIQTMIVYTLIIVFVQLATAWWWVDDKDTVCNNIICIWIFNIVWKLCYYLDDTTEPDEYVDGFGALSFIIGLVFILLIGGLTEFILTATIFTLSVIALLMFTIGFRFIRRLNKKIKIIEG